MSAHDGSGATSVQERDAESQMFRPEDRGDAEFASPDQGAPTNDVVVDPDTLRHLSRRQKKADNIEPNQTIKILAIPESNLTLKPLGLLGTFANAKDQGLNPPEY